MFALLSPAALSPGAAVGIDLGTTSSTIAVVRDGIVLATYLTTHSFHGMVQHVQCGLQPPPVAHL